MYKTLVMNGGSRETGLFWLSICFRVRDLYEPVIFLCSHCEASAS